MRFNGANLLGLILTKYKSRSEFADAMGMSRPTFLKRMTDGSFTLEEIEYARRLLGIKAEDTYKYFNFFCDESSQKYTNE